MTHDTMKKDGLLDGLESPVAVIYADGSCKGSNPGSIGWGMHGYIYDASIKAEKPLIVENHVITDKGYFRMSKDATSLNAVTPTKYIEFLGSQEETGTNNQAEIMAVYNSLKFCLENNIKKALILTDSDYTQKGLNQYCKNWERYNWIKHDGNPVLNRGLWQATYALFKQAKADGYQLNIEWIRGHNEHPGNDRADIMAGIGAHYSLGGVATQRFDIFDAKGYWKTEIDRHPFFNFKRLYFNSLPEHNNPGSYFQSDNGTAEQFDGKRVTETGMSIVHMNKPDKSLEDVKTRSYAIAKGNNAIMLMRLDRIFSKEVFPYLQIHGPNCFAGNTKNLNVDFADRKPVAVEVNPTNLSMRSLDAFNFLSDILAQFQELQEKGNDIENVYQLRGHDITDHFFVKEEKVVKGVVSVKYTLKPEFVVGFSKLNVDIKEPYEGSEVVLRVPLNLGTDLLPRNNLKRLEDLNPVIQLITWRESPGSIRYATVIQCDDGVGIWSNYYSDRIFFNSIKAQNP